jgi:hypothetical protein
MKKPPSPGAFGWGLLPLALRGTLQVEGPCCGKGAMLWEGYSLLMVEWLTL